MANPFYAGMVFFSRETHKHDPRSNTTRRTRNPHAQINKGKHEVAYSWEDYQAIQAEFERRKTLGFHNRHVYSGMLNCSICGKKLRHMAGVWRCPYPGKDHIALRTVEANYMVGHALKNLLLESKNLLRDPKTQDPVNHKDILDSLQRERKDVQRAWERHIYTLEEAEEKIQKIEKQIAAIQDENTRKAREQGERVQYLLALEVLEKMGDKVTEWIKKDEPKVVRSFLYRLCREIRVHPDREIEITLR